MATNNSVNTSLSGQTGTGAFAGSTSPTLVTPTLGAASATSLNFGGSSLANYVSATAWTPVFTFVTPGNLTTVYTIQAGLYSRIGSIVHASFNMSVTPVYTTASGALTITGLPLSANATANTTAVGSVSIGGVFNLGTTTWVICSIVAGTAIINLNANQSNTASSELAVGSFTTGNAVAITGNITYMV